MHKKFSTILAVLAVTAGLSAGCGSNAPQQSSTQQTAKSASQTAYPVTVKDTTGTDVTLQSEPQRIVSLLPSDTEILFALGLGNKIVGVSKWADYPAEAKTKPIVGDMKVDAEKVVAQKPDLVIGGVSANGQDLEALRKMGLTVYAIEPKTIAEVEQAIKEIGNLTNSAEKARELIASMEKKVNDIKIKTKDLTDDKRPRVYVEVSPAPDIYTAGKGTFMDEMIELAGGKNIFSDVSGWKKVDAEQIVAKNPQVIISTHGVTADVLKDLQGRSGWQDIPGVKDKKVIAVDTNLVSRPGPRIVDGLELFAKAIHPELFQ
jgi:iron complex transport system substrate-binding protein